MPHWKTPDLQRPLIVFRRCASEHARVRLNTPAVYGTQQGPAAPSTPSLIQQDVLQETAQ